MAAKFGTSGLRGLAEELIGAVAVTHVRAFLHHLKDKKSVRLGDEVFVAQDFRASSPALCENVREAIAQEGMAMRFFGHVPTPALAYEAMAKKCAGVMITGSHIPADRNGLKFYRPDGEIDKDDEKAISGRVRTVQASFASLQQNSLGEISGFVERYRRAFDASSLKGLRVGVYQHSSVARDLLVELLASAGARVTALARSEHFVPVDTEAVLPEILRLLRQWAADGAYDAIVSADGDGDRPLVADETGQVLRGDQLGLITAIYLGAKTVVTPVTSNSGIDRYIRAGTRRTRVGSPYVIAEMMKAKKAGAHSIVGFEANGGFFTASRFKIDQANFEALPTRDCFVAILAVLASAVRAQCSVSALAERYHLPVALSGRLENIAVATSGKLMARLLNSKAAQDAFFAPLGKIAARDVIDGLRVQLVGGGSVHLRPSGNAPEFRCYVEASTQGAAEALMERALGLITAEL